MIEAHYLVLDAFPLPGSPWFDRFVGAAIGCWIRGDLAACEGDLVALAMQNLSAEGWQVARVVEQERVSELTYARDDDEGRRLFEQARIDGFVARVRRTERELIELREEGSATELATALRAFARRLSSHAGVSLYSERDGQWANGVTPAGNEFLPLWQSADDASAWLEHWSGYHVRAVTPEHLRERMLAEINDGNMWVGVGLEPSRLTMFHPIALREALR